MRSFAKLLFIVILSSALFSSASTYEIADLPPQHSLKPITSLPSQHIIRSYFQLKA